MPYNRGLDGLRAVAIFLVALFHARAPAGLGGYLGVDVFLVLSGYLITSMLLAEIDVSGRIALLRFYLRRLWRLTPALFTMLAVYGLVAPLLWPTMTNHAQQVAIAAAYLSDYGVAFWGLPQLLSHTWTVSVEAHFYLLWPLALVVICRRWKGRDLLTVLATAYVLATLFRWVCVIQDQTWQQVYYRFDTRLSGLLLGAWFAAARRDARMMSVLQRSLPWLMWLPVVALICLQYPWQDIWMSVWGFAIAEWATLAILVALQTPGSQVSMMLSQPPLVWLGKMSYGIYLWHYPVFVYLRERHSWGDVLLIGLPLSVALGALSYYTVERWAGRRRSQLPVPRTA